LRGVRFRTQDRDRLRLAEDRGEPRVVVDQVGWPARHRPRASHAGPRAATISPPNASARQRLTPPTLASPARPRGPATRTSVSSPHERLLGENLERRAVVGAGQALAELVELLEHRETPG